MIFKEICLKTAAAIGTFFTASSAQSDVVFWSTQATPTEETQAMREHVLADAGQVVEYQAKDSGPWLARLQSDLQTETGTIGLLGALHGDFAALDPSIFVDLSRIDLAGVNPTLTSLGMPGTNQQLYLPWMQASYIMAANKKALEFLPDGVDIYALTYDQLIGWAANIQIATGEAKFGFPAGPKGLKHRFFQGYMYPSFTNGVVRSFKSDAAVLAWETFRDLWSYTNRSSTNFNFMQDPLLSEEVWIAFDHTSRLAEAFNQRPDDFIAFPEPSGPTGLGFMPVIAGIAIPNNAPDRDAALSLVAHMLKPEIQIATLRATNFFPVVDVTLPNDLPPSVKAAGDAVAKMSGASNANPSLLPTGLGTQGGDFNRVYVESFERIILGGQDIRSVLDAQAIILAAIMEETGAPCWAPDAASQGACPVE